MFDDQYLKIIKCDNGFVLEWHKPDWGNDSFSTGTGRRAKATSGTEIHKTIKDVLAAAKKRLT